MTPRCLSCGVQAPAQRILCDGCAMAVAATVEHGAEGDAMERAMRAAPDVGCIARAPEVIAARFAVHGLALPSAGSARTSELFMAARAHGPESALGITQSEPEVRADVRAAMVVVECGGVVLAEALAGTMAAARARALVVLRRPGHDLARTVSVGGRRYTVPAWDEFASEASVRIAEARAMASVPAWARDIYPDPGAALVWRGERGAA